MFYLWLSFCSLFTVKPCMRALLPPLAPFSTWAELLSTKITGWRQSRGFSRSSASALFPAPPWGVQRDRRRVQPATTNRAAARESHERLHVESQMVPVWNNGAMVPGRICYYCVTMTTAALSLVCQHHVRGILLMNPRIILIEQQVLWTLFIWQLSRSFYCTHTFRPMCMCVKQNMCLFIKQ